MGLALLLAMGALGAALLGTVLVSVELLRPPRRSTGYALARGLPVDPGQCGWPFTDVELVLADRTTTQGWIIAGHDAEGPLFLVLHGWGECRHDVLPRLEPVLRLASRVVVFDQRGHGESTARISRLGVREQADVLWVMDQIAPRCSDGDRPADAPFVLMGYSMGAGVAIGTATLADAQARVRAVVAEGPCRTMSHAVAAMLRLLRLPVHPFARLGPWLVSPWAPGIVRLDRAAQARRLPCPLLVLHGSDDPLCPLPCAAAIARAASQGRLVEFPGGGHLDLAQQDGPRYLAALRDLLTDLLAPSRSSPP